MNRAQRRAAQHHQAKPNGGAGSPAFLSPNVLAAFDRLAAVGGIGELPQWPRSVRIGIDYSLRVAAPNASSSAADCDNFAWTAMVLANLAQRDLERGDPPATDEARQHAGALGPDYERAYTLLDTIRDCEMELAGQAIPALAPPAMQILQRAARGEPVSPPRLQEILRAADRVSEELTSLVLRQGPGG